MKKIGWTDLSRKEEVSQRQGEEYPTCNKKKGGKLD